MNKNIFILKILDYTIPDKWTPFNFDEFEYFTEKTRSLPFEIVEPIRIALKNCSFLNETKIFSIFADLDSDNAINENSILLFELFGIANANTSNGKIINENNYQTGNFLKIIRINIFLFFSKKQIFRLLDF